MGAGVSNWRLAQAVSRTGQLGLVSGTALDPILARRLQDGDPGGHMRRGLDAFPFPAMAERVWQKYYIAGGKAERTPYLSVPPLEKDNPRELNELCIVANFVEVYLARQGHSNPVGINYLEKIQMAHLPCIYGAMLAGVEYVVMGAGIPLKIPGVLDSYVHHGPADYTIHVHGSQDGDDVTMHFDPREYMECDPGPLKRPKFLPIVSSNTLATTMLKKANGRVDGLVIETRTAGGHNAPPRGKPLFSEIGEPVYGERDTIDIAKLRELGVPFWLAGGYGNAEMVRKALDAGAAGVQVGTAFAFSQESGLRADLKQTLLDQAATGSGQVFTDPLASPTGFPFKVAQLDGTSSAFPIYQERKRVCDLGYLREPYAASDGQIGYRCAAEPVENYLSKGGKIEETTGRKCLCNALMANIGLEQKRKDGSVEPALVTVGDDLNTIAQFQTPGRINYSAADVVKSLLSLNAEVEEPAEAALAATA